MKHLKSLFAVTAITVLSSQATQADSVEISQDLSLIGFSGGTCNITVNASANATSLDLDVPNFGIDVGTVNTQCDYPYRVSVTSSERSPSGGYALGGQTPADFVEYNVMVDGLMVDTLAPSYEVGAFPPGVNHQMPVAIDVPSMAPTPGVYQGAVTFSVIID